MSINPTYIPVANEFKNRLKAHMSLENKTHLYDAIFLDWLIDSYAEELIMIGRKDQHEGSLFFLALINQTAHANSIKIQQLIPESHIKPEQEVKK